MSSSARLLFAGLDLAKHRDHSALTLTAVDTLNRTATTAGIKIWPHTDYHSVVKDTLHIFLKKRWRMLDLDVMPVGEYIVEEFDSLGVPVEPVSFSLKEKKAMMEASLLLLSQERYNLKGGSPNDQELLKQIREQEMVKSEAGNDRYVHPEGSHDDVLWSWCLSIRAARRYLFEQKASIFSTLDGRPVLGLYDENSVQGRIAKMAKGRWATFTTSAHFDEAMVGDSPGRWMETREEDEE